MEYKSNHFVARYYQKKWINKSLKNTQDNNDIIKVLIKKDGKVITDIPKNIAQKNNLYTFPNEFKTGDSKINEKLLIKHFEDWYIEGMKKSFDDETLPSPEDGYKLASFVIVQSFRTINFRKSNEVIISQNIDFKNSPKWHQNFSLHLSFLIIKGFPELIKNSRIIFYKAPTGSHFITSDNPASYWLSINNNYQYVSSVAENSEIKDNPNLRIVCPLSPKWCAEVLLFQKPTFLNLLLNYLEVLFRSKNQVLKLKSTVKALSANKFEQMQDMIYQSADKLIIGYNDSDLTSTHNRNLKNGKCS